MGLCITMQVEIRNKVIEYFKKFLSSNRSKYLEDISLRCIPNLVSKAKNLRLKENFLLEEL